MFTILDKDNEEVMYIKTNFFSSNLGHSFPSRLWNLINQQIFEYLLCIRYYFSLYGQIKETLECENSSLWGLRTL